MSPRLYHRLRNQAVYHTPHFILGALVGSLLAFAGTVVLVIVRNF